MLKLSLLLQISFLNSNPKSDVETNALQEELSNELVKLDDNSKGKAFAKVGAANYRDGFYVYFRSWERGTTNLVKHIAKQYGLIPLYDGDSNFDEERIQALEERIRDLEGRIEDLEASNGRF